MRFESIAAGGKFRHGSNSHPRNFAGEFELAEALFIVNTRRDKVESADFAALFFKAGSSGEPLGIVLRFAAEIFPRNGNFQTPKTIAHFLIDISCNFGTGFPFEIPVVPHIAVFGYSAVIECAGNAYGNIKNPGCSGIFQQDLHHIIPVNGIFVVTFIIGSQRVQFVVYGVKDLGFAEEADVKIFVIPRIAQNTLLLGKGVAFCQGKRGGADAVLPHGIVEFAVNNRRTHTGRNQTAVGYCHSC